MVHLPQISILGEKSLILFSSTYWQISFCQFFFFFSINPNLLINFLFFMTIYIPKMKVSYQSIDEILMIKEYWNLIDREPFFAIITWEPYFSQVCSFSKILKNHTNFRFTTIPDKTKDLIFLKSPKSLVFLSFLTIFSIVFSKKFCFVTYN